MPTAKERAQGGAIRYRTISPKPGTYIHIAITRKKGPRGGRTVAGEVHHTLRATKKHHK
jgi:hypothetical protein